MFKKTLVAALTVLALGTAIAASASPASAGCEHETSSYGNSDETPAYGYDHNEDRAYDNGNRYGSRGSAYDNGSRYGHRRTYDNGGY